MPPSNKRALWYVSSLAEKMRLEKQGYVNVRVDETKARQQVADARKSRDQPRITATPDPGARSAARVSSIVESGDREGRVGLAKDRSAQIAAERAAPPGIDLTNKDTVRYLQTVLKNAGFYRGRVDGVWGPQSEAANQAWQAAGQPAAPEDVGVTPVPTGGGAAFATGPAAAGGATPAAPSTTIEEDYPTLAPFLAIPEVGGLLRQAKSEGWPPEKLAARVQATNWWRTTPPAARAFMGLEATDPAAAQQKLAQGREEVKKLARDYLIPLSGDTLEQYTRQVVTGVLDAGSYRDLLVQQAKGRFPSLASALDQGLTVRQLADPFVQTAAKELEISPDMIDLDDPKWNRALQSQAADGKPQMMSLYEWQRTLRTDAVYQYDQTSGARRQASELATSLGQMFGGIG